jgi:hypothetical protein
MNWTATLFSIVIFLPYRDFSASGALERQVLLTAAREEDLSPGFFAPPASYKLQEMPQGMN